VAVRQAEPKVVARPVAAQRAGEPLVAQREAGLLVAQREVGLLVAQREVGLLVAERKLLRRRLRRSSYSFVQLGGVLRHSPFFFCDTITQLTSLGRTVNTACGV
jgi:hypothetical protein